MQTGYKRFSVVAGFLLLMIVLAANTFVIRRQLAVQIDDQQQTVHSRRILYELSQTESLVKDAETGQRGFLYTGDPKYLTPYDLAVAQVESHITNLVQLTADNRGQQTRILAFRGLVQEKLNELAQTITLYRSGRAEDAKALVLSDVGLFKMNEIRTAVGLMEQEETSMEGTRMVTYRKSIRGTILRIYLASSVAALGLVLLAFYILQEMKLRERHARQLLEREEWFRVTLNSLGDAVIATDEEGRVTFLNPLAEQLIGRSLENARGRAVQEVFPIFNESTHKVVENPVEKVMELGRIVGLANHTVLQNTDGTFIPIEDSAAPIRDSDDNLIGVVLVFRDATLERKSQEVLRKTEKLAAAARLAATVAHEINNPLEAVGNLIYITKGLPSLPVGAVEHLTLAEQELERVSHITRQTLGFYRESKTLGEIDVPALVDSVLRIYANKLRTKNITVEQEVGDCPPIRGLSGELKQVISNLISNAADAVSEKGTIWVRLSCEEDQKGKAVQVSIEDDGPGIPLEHRKQIFEPFFTTKKDVGTGLGLWVTKEIIDRHDGWIEVNDRKDGLSGTVFDIFLPIGS